MAGGGVELLMRICDEAASLYGDDWTKVESHIRKRMTSLRPHDKERLSSELAMILNFNRNSTSDEPQN